MKFSDFARLPRDIQMLPFWTGGTFDEAHALVDLILMMNQQKDNGEYKEGCAYVGREKLAKRWGWNIKKVDRFLRDFERLGLGTVKGTPKGTTLTFAGYASARKKGTPKGTPKGAAEGTLSINKEEAEAKSLPLPEEEIIYTPEELLKKWKESQKNEQNAI